MFVTGASQCIFAVYTRKMTYLMVVPRDEKFIQETVARLTQYYIHTYLPYLLKQNVHVTQDIMDAVQRITVNIFFIADQKSQ